MTDNAVAAPAPVRRPVFKEADFLAKFDELLAAGEVEQALTLLIDAFPEICKRQNVGRMEKLKHFSFAARRIQHAGLGKYGVKKIQVKARIVESVLKKHDVRNKGTFLDFGCGAHEPLALAAYFYARGFQRSIGNDMSPIKSTAYAAISMYDIVNYLVNFPEDFGIEPSERAGFVERIKRLDNRKFFNGDYDGGFTPVASEVEFVCDNILNVPVRPNEVSVLVSFAVLEHVTEIDKIMAHLFDITEPGGLHHHFIDLADHRFYRRDGEFNRFSFLTEEKCAPNLNRLRCSEQMQAFERAGFEVLKHSTQRETLPDETRQKFLPKWAEMSVEDQETYSLSVTVRKPG